MWCEASVSPNNAGVAALYHRVREGAACEDGFDRACCAVKLTIPGKVLIALECEIRRQVPIRWYFLLNAGTFFRLTKPKSRPLGESSEPSGSSAAQIEGRK